MHKSSKRLLPLLLVFSLPPLRLAAQLPESRHFQLTELAEGVYAAIHSIGGFAICNAGIVDLGEETLVFDTFLSPEAAGDLRKAAEALTGHPVRYVVNSHYHNDHIRGNQVFADGANIISTEWTRQAIAEQEPEAIKEEKDIAPKRLTELEKQYQAEKDPHQREELQMWIGYFQAMVQSFPRLKTILPNVTFTKELTIYGSKREARLISYEQGHTGSDLILYLPREKIVFTGDLIFIKMHPYLADGFPNHWIEILEDISLMQIQKVVPGHGPVGDADDVATMIHYIRAATEIVEKMSERGKSIEEILAQPIPSPFTNWYFPMFYKINMRFLYGRNEQGVESN